MYKKKNMMSIRKSFLSISSTESYEHNAQLNGVRSNVDKRDTINYIRLWLKGKKKCTEPFCSIWVGRKVYYAE
jgi:hypothetical protein